jgi:ACS family tartrate transporter-like MFS transporter
VWIARIMVTWGIISAGMMFVQNVTMFYVLRFLLGAAEAGFFPGMIFYMTHWFPAAYRSRAISLFMTAAVMSIIIGSPISGLLLEMDGVAGLDGWQWMFLIEALPSIVFGFLVFKILPNKPKDAKWMSSEEVNWLESRLETERSQMEKKHVSLGAAFADPRVLLLCVIYLCNVIGGYGLDFFQPTLIAKVFPDASPGKVGLINAVPAMVTIVVMVLYGRSSDRRKERKLHFAFALWWAAFGLLLASLTHSAEIALIALALAVSGRWSAIAPFWGMSTAFLSGRAAAGAIALINSVGNLGGYAGTGIMGFCEKQFGNNIVGLQVLAGIMFLGGVLTLLVRVPKPTAATQAAQPAE